MLSVIGQAACLSSLEDYFGDMNDKVHDAVDDKAAHVESDMEAESPYASGEMAGSIDTEVIKDTKDLYLLAVGPSDDLESGIPDMPYSVLQEFGTAHNAAQPFVRPAAEANKGFNIR